MLWRKLVTLAVNCYTLPMTPTQTFTFVITTRGREFSLDTTVQGMLTWFSSRGYSVHSMPSVDSVTFTLPGVDGVAAIVERHPLTEG